jgi:hypothetical protein
LVLERQGGERDDPPEQEGRNQSIRNAIEESGAPVGSKIVQGKKKRKDNQEGQMAQDEDGLDNKRIGKQPDRKQVKRMKQVEKKEI